MSRAIEQCAYIGFATPGHINHKHTALSLMPHNTLQGDRCARFAWSQTIGFRNGADRCANTNVDHIFRFGFHFLCGRRTNIVFHFDAGHIGGRSIAAGICIAIATVAIAVAITIAGRCGSR